MGSAMEKNKTEKGEKEYSERWVQCQMGWHGRSHWRDGHLRLDPKEVRDEPLQVFGEEHSRQKEYLGEDPEAWTGRRLARLTERSERKSSKRWGQKASGRRGTRRCRTMEAIVVTLAFMQREMGSHRGFEQSSSTTLLGDSTIILIFKWGNYSSEKWSDLASEWKLGDPTPLLSSLTLRGGPGCFLLPSVPLSLPKDHTLPCVPLLAVSTNFCLFTYWIPMCQLLF